MLKAAHTLGAVMFVFGIVGMVAAGAAFVLALTTSSDSKSDAFAIIAFSVGPVALVYATAGAFVGAWAERAIASDQRAWRASVREQIHVDPNLRIMTTDPNLRIGG